MQLTAKLVTLLPLQTGKGKNVDWKKQDLIVETGDAYPKKIFGQGEYFHHGLLMRRMKF